MECTAPAAAPQQEYVSQFPHLFTDRFRGVPLLANRNGVTIHNQPQIYLAGIRKQVDNFTIECVRSGIKGHSRITSGHNNYSVSKTSWGCF